MIKNIVLYSLFKFEFEILNEKASLMSSKSKYKTGEKTWIFWKMNQ